MRSNRDRLNEKIKIGISYSVKNLERLETKFGG